MLTEAPGTAADLLRDHVGLWDWRRRITELYAEIRRFDDPPFAWRLWRSVRDDLFRTHLQSPLDDYRRGSFAGLTLFDYDPALRCVVDLLPAPETGGHALSGGRDGYVQLIPFARTAGLDEHVGGELTLYWLGGYGGGVFLPFRDATTGKASFGVAATSSMGSRARTSASIRGEGRSSTSILPTTRPAPIPHAGSARSRRRRMSCRWRSPRASK